MINFVPRRGEGKKAKFLFMETKNIQVIQSTTTSNLFTVENEDVNLEFSINDIDGSKSIVIAKKDYLIELSLEELEILLACIEKAFKVNNACNKKESCSCSNSSN